MARAPIFVPSRAKAASGAGATTSMGSSGTAILPTRPTHAASWWMRARRSRKPWRFVWGIGPRALEKTTGASGVGDNSRGQLGVAPLVTPQSLFATRVRLAAPTTRLAASPGDTHCAITEDSGVQCWGWNQYAQAGAPPSSSVGPTVVLTAASGEPLRGVVDLAPDHQMQAMCARTMSGLVCWGNALQPGGARAVSPYPAPVYDAATGQPMIAPRVPLAAYGGVDGSLVYVDPEGDLALGAGAPGFTSQPPCP
jgi:hypothetical protein